MYSTHTIKRAAATLTVGFLLAIVLVSTAQAGNVKPRGMSTQEWKALMARSDAMNRYYHLGRYAVVRSSSRFVWTDAGVGAGATLGAIIVAGGIVAALRRRSADRPSLPTAA